MTSTVELVQHSHQAFQDRLARTTVEDFALPTPCDAWDVAGLLRHVVGGNRMVLALLDGAEATQIGPLFAGTSELEGSILLDAARESTELAANRLMEADPDKIVHFPLGDMPAGRLQAFRTTDLVLHAWDLARALEVDDTLPDDVVEACLANLQLMADSIPKGMFGEGPSGTLAADARSQEKLLDLSGRRP